jgi:putative peptidoglycan lipid II flippase
MTTLTRPSPAAKEIAGSEDLLRPREARASLAGRSLWRTLGRVAPAALATQALSFGSSIILALILGASDQTDAYFLALSVPVVVYSVLIAATRLGMIPTLSDVGTESATAFNSAASEMVGAVMVVAIVLGTVVTATAVIVLPMVVGGSAHLIHLTRMMMVELSPYALTGALVGALGAVLAVRGRFVAAVAVTGIEPITKSILVVLLHHRIGAYALIWGNLLGGASAAVVLWILVRREGIRLCPRFRRRSEITKSLVKISAPLIIAQSVLQVNPLIDRGTAAGLSRGSVTVLELGLRLFTVPTLLLGALLIAPLTATWSARKAEGGQPALGASFGRAFAVLVVALPPFVVAGFVFRHPLISAFYSGGDYSPSAIAHTSEVFGMLLLGLPAQIAVVALATLFIVQGDAIFPMKIACANVVLNLVLDLALRVPLGVAGVALGTTITVSVLGAFYLVVACSRWESLALRQVRRPAVCTVFSVAAMTAGAVAVSSVLPPHAPRITSLAIVTGGTLLACGIHALVLCIGRVGPGQFIPVRLPGQRVRTAPSGP